LPIEKRGKCSMSKRFTDTEIWKKKWFQKLTTKQRMLFIFIKDNCDCAGVYEPDSIMLSFFFKTEDIEKEIEAINKSKLQIIKLENGRFFVIDFIEFQNKVKIENLNPNFNPHKGILASLNKNNVLSTLVQPLGNPSEGLQGKGMGKGIDKDKSIDIYLSPEIEKVFEIYKSECPDLIALTFERKNGKVRESIGEFLNVLDYDLEEVKEICKKANALVTIATNKIDLQSILNNYTGIKSGKYLNKTAKKGLTQNDIDKIFED